MMSLYDPYADGDLKRQKQGYTAVCLIGLPKGDLARWQKYTVFCPKNQAFCESSDARDPGIVAVNESDRTMGPVRFVNL